jgi:hypothetical protein
MSPGFSRGLWPTASRVPAVRAAPTAATASATVKVSGLSQKTGLPAAATMEDVLDRVHGGALVGQLEDGL